MVRFSVIIPVYGKIIDNNFYHCLESLSKQTFKDFEIIISGIDVLKNCNEISGIKIKTVIIPDTNKLGKLINEAVNISEGEYIHLWNFDLITYPDYLERLNEHILIGGSEFLYTGRIIDTRSLDNRNHFNDLFFKSYDLCEGPNCFHRQHFEPFREEFEGFATHWLQEFLYRMWKKLKFICLRDLEVFHIPHLQRLSLEECSISSFNSNKLFNEMK